MAATNDDDEDDNSIREAILSLNKKWNHQQTQEVLNLLMSKLLKIQAEKKTMQATINSMQSTINSMKDTMNQMKDKTNIQEVETAKLTEVCHNLEDSNKKQECDKVQNGVVVRGLPLNKDAKNGKETTDQTLKQIKHWIKSTNLTLNSNDITKCHRGPNKYNSKPGAIFIYLNDSQTKRSLYQDLSQTKENELKDSNYNKIAVTDIFPSYLKKDLSLLEEKAYQIRQSEPGTKTRIVLRDLQLTLTKKLPGEEFIDVNINENNSSKMKIPNETEKPHRSEPKTDTTKITHEPKTTVHYNKNHP